MTLEPGKRQIYAEIERMKGIVETASVEEVDEPTGTKKVDIAYETSDSFIVEQGEAYLVSMRPDRESPQRVKIHWCDESPHDNPTKDMTSVAYSNIETFEEGEYST